MKSIWDGIKFISESGSLVVPIIIFGEMLISFCIYSMSFYSGSILGIGIGIALILIFCFAVPIAGTIAVLILRLLLIATHWTGKLFGIALGLLCAIFYFMTLWAPVGIALVTCALAGMMTGFVVAKVTGEILFASSQGWLTLNYILLTLAGGIGGWFFVSHAESAATGGKVADLDEITSGMKKPARFIRNAIDNVETFSQEGERYQPNQSSR